MTSKRPIIVIGAGGHGRVVADALLANGCTVSGFIDANPHLHGHRVLGLPVLGSDDFLEAYSPDTWDLVNGIGTIGNPSRREDMQLRLAQRGWTFTGVIHPSATVSPYANIASDTQVLARACIQPGASTGAGCIINTGAIIEHDTCVGAWCHIAPGAIVCGDCSLGCKCHIGAGAVIRQGISLGPNTVVGSGASVVQDFAGNGTLLGVPARQKGK